MALDSEQLACCSAMGGTPSPYNTYCENIPISGASWTGISFDPCNYDSGVVSEEVVNSNPFDWNGLLSTLGAIAVPFLPFIFGTAGSSPSSEGATDNTEQLKSQQGMLIMVGFVILIALSVGAYILIKKRR